MGRGLDTDDCVEIKKAVFGDLRGPKFVVKFGCDKR